MLRCVVEAMIECIRSRLEDPDYSLKAWENKDEVKDSISGLIGCNVEELAFTPNVSLGVLGVASSLKQKGFKSVVCVSYDFPSVTLPWKALGYRVCFASVHSEEEIIKVYDRNGCDVVSVSHVNYLTGERIDLGRLVDAVHARGGLVLIDAYQSMGVSRVDVKREDVDFLVFGFGKWLLGPVVSILYVKSEHIENMNPINASWLSNREPLSFQTDTLTLAPTAERFEGASLDYTLKVGASKSAEVFSNVNYKEATRRVLNMTERTMEILESLGFKCETPRNPERRLGIVSFRVADAVKAVEKLRDMGVIASARKGRVRLSIHFFTGDDELARLEEALTKIV